MDVELDERRAEALHLFLHDGPRIECFDDRANAPRGGDRLQTGDSGADHEHARGPHRSGGRHQHWEEFLRARWRRGAPPCSRQRCSATTARPSSALDVVRGTSSMLQAVIVSLGELLEKRRVTDDGCSSPMNTVPSLHHVQLGSAARSSRPGRCTLRIICAVGRSRRRVDDFAARTTVGFSVKPARRPASCSIATRWPARVSCDTTSGTRATRRSPLAISRGTPISIRSCPGSDRLRHPVRISQSGRRPLPGICPFALTGIAGPARLDFGRRAAGSAAEPVGTGRRS